MSGIGVVRNMLYYCTPSPENSSRKSVHASTGRYPCPCQAMHQITIFCKDRSDCEAAQRSKGYLHVTQVRIQPDLCTILIMSAAAHRENPITQPFSLMEVS